MHIQQKNKIRSIITIISAIIITILLSKIHIQRQCTTMCWRKFITMDNDMWICIYNI